MMKKKILVPIFGAVVLGLSDIARMVRIRKKNLRVICYWLMWRLWRWEVKQIYSIG